jgi:hypothetical protein
VRPRPRSRRLTVALALLFLAVPASARATYYINPPPDYVRSLWFRIGVTSEGRFSVGLAFDALPATAGIDFSPGSALGPLRVFAGLKAGLTLVPVSCSGWAGLSGGAVYAFGPKQSGHFGMGLGAHLAHMPLPMGGAQMSFPQLEEGLAYRFSWFPGAGVLHEGSLDLGLYWTPGADCESD